MLCSFLQKPTCYVIQMQLATRTICEEVIHILGKCQEFDIFYVECRKDPPIAKNILAF